MIRRRRPFLLHIGLVIASVVYGSQAVAQVKPASPQNLCIQDSTGPSSCSNVSRVVKWNPGHYVRPNTLGFVSNASDRAWAFEKIRNDSMFKGGLISVPWGSIEPQEGVYNFAPIDHDLQLMKAMGKKLIIEVWWQKYGGTPDTRYFPQYIIDAGGIGSIPSQSEHHVKINETRWADRYIALQKALAARYDNDPDVEQTVITETASTTAYEFKRIVPAVASLWHRTQVVLYPNWVDTPELARDLLAIMAPLGVGVGAPDIIGPPGMKYEDHGSQALRGVGVQCMYADCNERGDFGSVDYRGQIPVAYQYQALSGVGAASVIDYAMNTLKATHLIWSIGEDGSAATNWATGVLPVVKGVSGKTITTYPSRLPK